MRIWPEVDSVTAAPLLCMMIICMKLHNLGINCSVQVSVIAHCNSVIKTVRKIIIKFLYACLNVS